MPRAISNQGATLTRKLLRVNPPNGSFLFISRYQRDSIELNRWQLPVLSVYHERSRIARLGEAWRKPFAFGGIEY